MVKVRPLSFLFAAEVLLLMAVAYMQPAHALTAPTNLTANVASTTQINLKWDRVWGASSYRVFRASKQIATVRGNSFSNINLAPNTTYSYNVAAVDTRWRQSPLSNTATATTLTDTNPPPVTTAEVGYIGCSMTIGAINGALRLNPSGYWPVYNIGGGGVSKWADLNSQYWKDFQAAYNANPVKTFWFELCALSTEKDKETIDAAMAVIDELKRRVPDAVVYVSAQPTYSPSSHTCGIAGADGPGRMADIAAQLVASGEALAGPTQGPLAYPSQVKTDGCHPVTSGEDLLGKQVQDFFFNLNPPGPSNSNVAHGLVVVDDGDADFSKALVLPYVDGALVRTRWSQNEPSEGKYSFATVCSKISQAYKAGKKASLVNYPLVPSWLLSKIPVSETWTHPQFGKQSVPWSSVAQTALKSYATAQAESTCDGFKLKEHPALANVDTPILGMLSIRDAPTYELKQMTEAILASIKIWHDAFYVKDDKKVYYTGLFPINRNANDSIAIWDAVEAAYPMEHAFMENLTGAGPSGTLVEPLKSAQFKMLQSCAYWSDQSRIKCSFSNPDSPQIAYDNVVKKLGVKYWEVYPDDLLFPSYQSTWEQVHKDFLPTK